MGKHYTDRDRLDMVKKYRQSGLGLSEFARQEHINRSTIKDWVSAYHHLQGDFIRLDNLDSKQGTLIDEARFKKRPIGLKDGLYRELVLPISP